MLIHLSIPWLIAVNVVAWPVFHLGIAWLATRVPTHWFDPSSPLYRIRPWERGGSVYERMGVRRWKKWLPDGAAWFRGGFPKRALASADAEYRRRFLIETCRGEWAHWMQILSAALFFLWNPWSLGLVMVAYALAANMPCIIAQRFNRIRLARSLGATALHASA